MAQVETREEIFNKWRQAKDAEQWELCDNCARDLLSTLDKSSGLAISLKEFYNNLDIDADKERRLLKNIQDKAPALQRERYNTHYIKLLRWWAGELYNEFYNKFFTEGYIKQEG